MNALDEYKKAISKVLSVSLDSDMSSMERGVTPDWDSVGHVALISELEEIFDVMFEIEDILEFKTFDQGIEILRRYGVEI